MLSATGNQQYGFLVATAYENAPIKEKRAIKHYDSLNKSNHVFWKRLLSRINVTFYSTFKKNEGKIIKVLGKEYKIIHSEDYTTQSEMKKDVEEKKTLKISIDYSTHPYFSLEDNIIFRTVHDYIVHILGNKQFGLHGEIQSYNLHAKLVPPQARPAIFTEVVGQASYATVFGNFPIQKAAILDGFDYDRVGEVQDYDIINKQLKKREGQ